MVTIQEIYKPIEQNLQEFDKYFDTLLSSDIEIVEQIIKYLSKTKGKQIRPILVLLTSQLFSPIKHNTYVAAAMLELFHNATLIHDDVVDEADKRRGYVTINNIWSNQTAILIGDFFLAKGLISALDHNEFEFLKATSHAIQLMSEGELLQIQKSNEIDLSEETYFRIIRGKTASLISTCCKLGAIAGGACVDDINALSDFGDHVGIAFQIRDDILDFIGDPEVTGKTPGNDLKEKKLTLPILFALKQTSEEQANKYLSLIKEEKLTQADIDEIIQFVIDKKGIDYAQEVSNSYINKAMDIINAFPESEARNSLIKFADFIIQRNK